ncbi:MAG: esterase/lipase family protein [Solirubrobacterales bacterium]
MKSSSSQPQTPAVMKPLGGQTNRDPIILVHGLAGFGREELFGYRYWGGLYDLQESLERAGHTVYTAAIGPFSSNWDRACELYAQIKGGTVDYGESHSASFGHKRYGRTFPGFYPQWGTLDPATGKVRKVHLVGHSMGGQTSRTLAQLLEAGAPMETNAVSPLFQGGQPGRVRSITSISTPHDGSSLVYTTNAVWPFLQQIIAAAGMMSSLTERPFYDFKLDHWGLGAQPGEPFLVYFSRIAQSSLWSQSHDTATWDLSPEGAAALNAWTKACADVLYFSWSTSATIRLPFTGQHIPSPKMSPFWIPYAYAMGIYSQPGGPDRIQIDEHWWENDGWVNTISMDGPKLNSSDRIVPYDGTPRPGVWNHMGQLHGFDHTDVVGIGSPYPVDGWYHRLAEFLESL